MDEKALTERLIGFDSSTEEGIERCAAFAKAWLEARDISVVEHTVRERPVLLAEVGSPERQTLVLHGHLDVVPGHEEQFTPRVEGERLIGRGAYDMKGALAGMMLAVDELRNGVGPHVRLAVVCDEETEEERDRGTDFVVAHGFIGDFAITGEPTDLLIGVQAKGVLAMRLEIEGRSAHGSTPWLGDNAALKALDVFRRIESLPFARESSELFDRPSINLGRIWGGDALNKVPDRCVIDVDIRYLPAQDPKGILGQIEAFPGTRVVSTFQREPVAVDPEMPTVRALCDAVADYHEDGGTTSVGRDGTSDAVSFLRAGVPAVEFGPVGGDHHGPEEWVSIPSLATYRQALVRFARTMNG